jgi:hypothetical protein
MIHPSVLAGKDQSKNAKPMFGSAITILSSRGYERRSDRQPLCLRVTTSFRGSFPTMKAPFRLSPPKEPPDSSHSPRVEKSTDQYVDPEAENPAQIPPHNPKASFFTYNLDVDMQYRADGAAKGVKLLGAQLLSAFLSALHKMDKDASILLVNSASEDQKINESTNFPADEPKLKAFASKYIGSLRLNTKFNSMKGYSADVL